MIKIMINLILETYTVYKAAMIYYHLYALIITNCFDFHQLW